MNKNFEKKRLHSWKLHPITQKTLGVDAHSVLEKMVADAAALRRENAPRRILFYMDSGLLRALKSFAFRTVEMPETKIHLLFTDGGDYGVRHKTM